MRIVFFFLFSVVVLGCSSGARIRRITKFHNGIFPLKSIHHDPPPSGNVSVVENSLPGETQVVGAGVLILPLLFYNRFQSNFQIVLGADFFSEPWSEYVLGRLTTLKEEFKNAGLPDVALSLKKSIAFGKYISGSVTIVVPSTYFNNVRSISISKSKNSTAELTLGLMVIDQDGAPIEMESMIKLRIEKNTYSGTLKTFSGKTINLTSSDLNYHLGDNSPTAGVATNEPNLTVHLYRLADLLVLGLDELIERAIVEMKGKDTLTTSLEQTVSLQMQARNILWSRLEMKKLGVRFDKGYLANGNSIDGSYDFVSNRGKLIIVIGNSEGISVDAYIYRMGSRTAQYDKLRFTPEEVIQNPDKVIEEIRKKINR